LQSELVCLAITVAADSTCGTLIITICKCQWDYKRQSHHATLSSYLLLICCWVGQVLARRLDGLGSTSELCLVHKSWAPSNTGWFRHSY
jgi:hypothetical protein